MGFRESTLPSQPHGAEERQILISEIAFSNSREALFNFDAALYAASPHLSAEHLKQRRLQGKRVARFIRGRGRGFGVLQLPLNIVIFVKH